jgi:diacylglycerol kinase
MTVTTHHCDHQVSPRRTDYQLADFALSGGKHLRDQRLRQRCTAWCVYIIYTMWERIHIYTWLVSMLRVLYYSTSKPWRT